GSAGATRACCHERALAARRRGTPRGHHRDPTGGDPLPVLLGGDAVPDRGRRLGVPQLLAGVLDQVPRPALAGPGSDRPMIITESAEKALRREVAQAARDLEEADALEVLRWAYDRFGSGLVVTSSMADTVLIHLAEQVVP